MSISAIALSGMRASQMRLTASASNTARSIVGPEEAPTRVEQHPAPNGGGTVATYAPGKGGGIDLTDEAVTQLAVIQEFKANAKLLGASDSMTRSTLELWG